VIKRLNLGGGTVLRSLTREVFLIFGEWRGGSEILVQGPPWVGIRDLAAGFASRIAKDFVPLGFDLPEIGSG
jgi:hypothetical protein